MAELDPATFQRRTEGLRQLCHQLNKELTAINNVLRPEGVICTLHDKTNHKLDHLVVKIAVAKPTKSTEPVWDPVAQAWTAPKARPLCNLTYA